MKRVQLIFVFLLVCTAFVTSQPHPDVPCIAVEIVDNNLEEDWDFRIPSWENYTVTYTSSDYNIPPMSGVYTFEYSFCSGLNIYIGNTAGGTAFGWTFGSMLAFVGYDVTPDVPLPPSPSSPPNNDHVYRAYQEFSQYFVDGDGGAPCTADIGRSAAVNIFCGLSKANCTQIPGNTGPACLNALPTTGPGFCLCSIQYNKTVGLCRGLVLNLLSNQCPPSRAVYVPTPNSPNIDQGSRAVGIAFSALAVIFLVAMIGGYIYNITVHAKRGCQAVPFYDTCSGRRDVPVYTGQPGEQPAKITPIAKPPGGYGSI